MKCTTVNRWRSDSQEVQPAFARERLALGFNYFPNFQLARQTLQDAIIQTLFTPGAAPGQNYTFMMGVPGSGKSTAARARAQQQPAVVIDADWFKTQLPEFHQFPRHLASGVVHREAACLAAIAQRHAETLNVNIIIDMAAANFDWLTAEIARVRALGRPLTLIYTRTAPACARARCHARERHVPDFVIAKLDQQITETYMRVRDQFDQVEIIET